MLHVILYQPEIPPNTGNIIRLCANSGAQLHLIHPLGFTVDDKRLRRAGLDYHAWTEIKHWSDFSSCIAEMDVNRLFALTTKATNNLYNSRFKQGDALLFGSETRGLPADILQQIPAEHHVRLPMKPEMRSLNLSNAVAITVYEAWRQLDFA